MKQVTRWFGKENIGIYSIWFKEPRWSKKYYKFHGSDNEGRYNSLDFASTVCTRKLLATIPNLKMKVGQLKKVRIIVEDEE